MLAWEFRNGFGMCAVQSTAVLTIKGSMGVLPFIPHGLMMNNSLLMIHRIVFLLIMLLMITLNSFTNHARERYSQCE